MDLINSFAVVAYLNSGLGRLLDSMRQEITPGCPHHAHLTILPPRPLFVDTAQAVERCREITSRFEPFNFTLGDVDLFESTQVIKIPVVQGVAELKTLHAILNTGPFEHSENYEYIPHVTVGQELPAETVTSCLELARKRWAEFDSAAPLRVESLTLVRQLADDRWHDLAELCLGRPQPVQR